MKKLKLTQIADRIICRPVSKDNPGELDYSIANQEYLEDLDEANVQVGLLVYVQAQVPFWGYIVEIYLNGGSGGL